MIIGVGTDLLKFSTIAPMLKDPEDPFIRRIYTDAERELIRSRMNPLASYATRFAGKEAVFKTFGVCGDSLKLNEIEILEDETGQPCVTLYGNAAKIAEAKKIRSIHISLSFDTDAAAAFAVAEG